MTIFRSKISLSVLLLGAAAGSLSAAVAQAAKARPETYTVKTGDTLFSIARQLYGDEAMWAQLYRLNSESISDPKWIRPGQVLKLVPGGLAKPAKEPTVPAKLAQAERPKPEAPKPEAPKAEAPKAEQPAAAEREPEIIKPRPTPERKPVVTEPETPQQPAAVKDTLFSKRRGIDAYSALRTYREQPYRPLRRGEFFAAGFLTEGEKLPFGKVLGEVTPQQIRNISERTMAQLYTHLALEPPAGAQYRVNDSLLAVEVDEGPEGYGDIIRPVGMIRVIGQNGDQAIGSVVALYGSLRGGHLVMPVEKFVEGGTMRAQPVEKPVSGVVLAQREVRELKHPANFLFISVGKKDGVNRGDLFEVRRDPERRESGVESADEPMALMQVVHVRERSATVKIINVMSPDIRPGTRVKQVAKLPS
jgi:LysM repeat protein